jgi:hypothetical protein
LGKNEYFKWKKMWFFCAHKLLNYWDNRKFNKCVFLKQVSDFCKGGHFDYSHRAPKNAFTQVIKANLNSWYTCCHSVQNLSSSCLLGRNVKVLIWDCLDNLREVTGSWIKGSFIMCAFHGFIGMVRLRRMGLVENMAWMRVIYRTKRLQCTRLLFYQLFMGSWLCTQHGV